MQSDVNHAATPTEPMPGLPPVQPPSGRFIAQLFLVPGLIVVVAVGILWGFTWLVGGARTPEQFLKDLRNHNPDIRWRAASDLVQVLRKDKNLAADASFGLDVAELLRQSLRDNEQLQTQYTGRSRSDADDRKPLDDDRAYVQYLINCLGNFSVPVGVPILNEVALKEDGADPGTGAFRRQLAVWALGNAGENVKQCDQWPAELRQRVVDKLEEEIAKSSGERRRWAQTALNYLKARPGGGLQGLGVDESLARCAKASDPLLRKIVAFALNLWEGDAAESARMETTLLALSYDDGHGAAEDARVRGLEIRYKAVEGLARHGSEKINSRLPVLEEMLDPEELSRNFVVKGENGQETPDMTAVRSTVISALKAVAELHHKRPSVNLESLYPAIDKLTKSDNPVYRTEAERTELALGRK